jgi:hypothetical protein
MPVPRAAKLARLISTKPGLITTNDPINPINTADHRLKRLVKKPLQLVVQQMLK